MAMKIPLRNTAGDNEEATEGLQTREKRGGTSFWKAHS